MKESFLHVGTHWPPDTSSNSIPYPEQETKIKQLWRLIGDTPMIEITYRYKGAHRTIYVKCEHFNLTGSIKDRMALYIIEQAYQLGAIKPGDTIIEASSGNTGIAFSAIGKALGHPVKIIMPDWLSKERVDIIKSLGADIILISKEQGGFMESIRLSEQLRAENEHVFLPQQFENCYNVAAHEKTTGKEIWMQLQAIDTTPEAFVAGVGTGGTVMGVGNYLRSRHPAIKIYPLEPAESPTLSTGYKTGTHRIQGISDDFIPAIVDLGKLERPLKAADGDAILMAQQMARQLGLAVGISSGANIVGAIQLQNVLGAHTKVVTVLCDCNKKYLSTDLMKDEPAREDYITPYVELLEYKALSS